MLPASPNSAADSGVSWSTGWGSTDGGSDCIQLAGAAPPAHQAPGWPEAGAGVTRRLVDGGRGQQLNSESPFQGICGDAAGCESPWERSGELTLGACIGTGGFGRVYRGIWHKAPVAVKIVPTHADSRLRAYAAMEVAVLSVAQHPNIVRIFSFLTDMVETSCPAASDARGFSRVEYRRPTAREGALDALDTVNIIVLELCDRGSLLSAVRAGELHRRPSSRCGGAPGAGVDFEAAVEALLDAAYAVRYLHSMSVVHGDVKLDNVLLQTAVCSRRGYVCKLADLGCAKVLSNGTAHNPHCSGTLTHLAPEALDPGSKITSAVDAYAFGIMIWELWARAEWPTHFIGAGAREATRRASVDGVRPTFPEGTPGQVVALARDCWSSAAAARPSFGQIARRLEAMLAGCRGRP